MCQKIKKHPPTPPSDDFDTCNQCMSDFFGPCTTTPSECRLPLLSTKLAGKQDGTGAGFRYQIQERMIRMEHGVLR